MAQKAKMISKSDIPSSAITTQDDDNTMTNLNAKQKAFVHKVVLDSMKPTDAYMAVYEVTNRATAANSASRLMKHPAIKSEFQSLSVHLEALSHVPKHLVVKEINALLSIVKTPGKDFNPKYIIECLDMINKIMGFYNHTTTNVSIKVDKSISFGGFDPSDAEYIDITNGKDDE